MGYDLTNDQGDSHQWKVLGWWMLLNLGKKYGWIPASTEPPVNPTDEVPWEGNYFRNDCQRVTAADAAALAVALERMLLDPQHTVVAETLARRIQDVVDDPSISVNTNLEDVMTYPLELVRGMMKHFRQTTIVPWRFDDRSDQYLRDFIVFARKGSFCIG